jgi:hypothetical protein
LVEPATGGPAEFLIGLGGSGDRAATATGLGWAGSAWGSADASGADATCGVGAPVSLEAVEKGFEKGLSNVWLNRVESAEHPESQIPTNPVRATRAAFRRTTTVANLLIVFNPLERN